MQCVSTSEQRSCQGHKLWIPPDHIAIARPQRQYSKSHQGRSHCQEMERGQVGMHSVGKSIHGEELGDKTRGVVWEPSMGGGDYNYNAMPQCTGYVYKRLSVCNRPSAVNDTVRKRKACQSDVVAKVALLIC